MENPDWFFCKRPFCNWPSWHCKRDTANMQIGVQLNSEELAIVTISLRSLLSITPSSPTNYLTWITTGFVLRRVQHMSTWATFFWQASALQNSAMRWALTVAASAEPITYACCCCFSPYSQHTGATQLKWSASKSIHFLVSSIEKWLTVHEGLGFCQREIKSTQIGQATPE